MIKVYLQYISKISLLLILFLTSCGVDTGSSSGDSDKCSIYPENDKANFFDRGDYGFSCMDDDGDVTIEYPVIANNHRLIPQNENAVPYIMSVSYHETKDKAIGGFLFAKVFADSISEEKEEINGVGAQAHFYTIVEDETIKNYIVFRDCNFVGTITGEYESDDGLPCNMGKDAFIAFANEMMRNL